MEMAWETPAGSNIQAQCDKMTSLLNQRVEWKPLKAQPFGCALERLQVLLQNAIPLLPAGHAAHGIIDACIASAGGTGVALRRVIIR